MDEEGESVPSNGGDRIDPEEIRRQGSAQERAKAAQSAKQRARHVGSEEEKAEARGTETDQPDIGAEDEPSPTDPANISERGVEKPTRTDDPAS